MDGVFSIFALLKFIFPLIMIMTGVDISMIQVQIKKDKLPVLFCMNALQTKFIFALIRTMTGVDISNIQYSRYSRLDMIDIDGLLIRSFMSHKIA